MAEKSTESKIEALSQVKFVGPAKAEAIVKQLGVGSIEELLDAAKNGRLQQVKGIGAALSKRIQKSAADALKKSAGAAEKAKPAEKTASKTAAAEKKAAPKKKAESRAPRPKAVESKTAESKKKAAAQKAQPKAASQPKKEAPQPKKPAPPKKPAARNDVDSAAKSAPEKLSTAPGVAARAGADAAGQFHAAPSVDSREALVDRFIATLRCPACGHDEFERGATTLTCTACRREYNFHSGVVDLAPPNPSGRSLSQRVMESRFYARFYEDLMRPRLTGVVSDRTLGEEYILAGEMLELDGDTRLLDVAAGTGNFTRYFAHQVLDAAVPSAEPLVVGMDLSWPMLETARTYLRRDGLDEEVFLIRGDATRIPARRAAFNRLHCAGALHLMNNIDEALRNFARVLEPEGVCVISSFILGDGILRRLTKRVAEIPTKFHWFTRDELHQRLRRAGFEVVEDSIAGDAITVKAVRT